MSAPEETWNVIAASFAKKKDVAIAKMMGHPSLKTAGKLFCCFFEDDMVFKLSGEAHKKALALKGAKLFDPGGMGRAMKEWVQVPPAHSRLWPQLTEQAMEYVKRSAKK